MPVRGEAGVVHPLMLLLRYADYEADRRLAREQVLQAVRLLDGSRWLAARGLKPFTAAFSRCFSVGQQKLVRVGNRVRAMGPGGGSWPSSVRPAAGSHHRLTPASVAIIGCP
jgi:hypothetical protein